MEDGGKDRHVYTTVGHTVDVQLHTQLSQANRRYFILHFKGNLIWYISVESISVVCDEQQQKQGLMAALLCCDHNYPGWQYSCNVTSFPIEMMKGFWGLFSIALFYWCLFRHLCILPERFGKKTYELQIWSLCIAKRRNVIRSWCCDVLSSWHRDVRHQWSLCLIWNEILCRLRVPLI